MIDHVYTYSLRENKLGDSGVGILCDGVMKLKCNNLITLEYVAIDQFGDHICMLKINLISCLICSLFNNSITDESLTLLRKLIACAHSLEKLE
jgi:hypothetical protein